MNIATTCLIAVLVISSVRADTPPEVVKLTDDYNRAVERAMSPLKTKYHEELRKLQDRYTKAGNLDAALEVRKLLEPSVASTAVDSNAKPLKTVIRGDFVYELIDQKLTWDDARTECKKLGGELASFDSLQEWERIARILPAPQEDEAVWIGAFRPEGTAGPWSWSDGTDLTKSISAAIAYSDQPQRNAVRAGLKDAKLTADGAKFKRGFICKKKK